MDSSDKENKSDEEFESPEEEEVDPRIQDARQKFRSVLVEATLKLDELVKKIGKAVEESKPYWEARRVARQTQLEAQRSTQDFQRATEVLRVAKETIALAEQRLLENDKRQFDSAWQEMLNHATQRVMEAEQIKTRSELLHKETAAKYTASMSHMKQLEKKLKRTINKSKPYFEMKAKYYLQLEQLKKNVDDLQAKLTQAKGEYKSALRNLEMISDEIHERRRSSGIGPRERGVGAEGDGVTGEDLSGFKLESDGISMASGSYEDENCSTSAMSEEDSETQSNSSFSSVPNSPLDLLCPFSSSSSSSGSPTSTSPTPSSRPCSLDLPSTVSLSDFSLMSPILGPRSECSGASSPECDLERGDRAEGAEALLDNVLKNNNSISNTKTTFGLDSRFRLLSLKLSRNESRKTIARAPLGLAQQPSPATILLDGM
uniref:SH3 domain-binding protein 5 n=1 Tax=Cyprinus carpio carpio TaxID=630221 RepID=A0A9J8B2D3_CYPCA